MNKPQTVDVAVKAIWVSVGAGILVTLIEKASGNIDDGAFFFGLIFSGLFCIFPYKIGMGSNGARYIYTVLTVLTYILFLGVGAEGYTILSLIICVVFVPVDIFILYKLFQGDSNRWFEAAKA